MIDLTTSQWFLVILAFVLGLVLGMLLTSGAKWKRRYQEEHVRRTDLQAENDRLHREAREMDSLRGAAARTHHHEDRRI
jgi:uncharacterized membrane-anchored protein YhcB (DUF1043 family)